MSKLSSPQHESSENFNAITPESSRNNNSYFKTVIIRLNPTPTSYNSIYRNHANSTAIYCVSSNFILNPFLNACVGKGRMVYQVYSQRTLVYDGH